MGLHLVDGSVIVDVKPLIVSLPPVTPKYLARYRWRLRWQVTLGWVCRVQRRVNTRDRVAEEHLAEGLTPRTIRLIIILICNLTLPHALCYGDVGGLLGIIAVILTLRRYFFYLRLVPHLSRVVPELSSVVLREAVECE